MFLCVLSLTAAPTFIPPDDTRPLLRRELLPLDVPTMLKLGKHLAILASLPGEKNALDLQRKARLLALSQRLHPTHPKSRRLIESYREGDYKGFPKPGQRNTALKFLTQTAQWLLEMPAHSEGRHLASLILDILPENHPLAGQKNPDDIDLRWAGVVAPINTFQGITEKAPEPSADPETKKPQNAGSQYLTRNIRTQFPFFFQNPNAKRPEAKLHPITLNIHEEGHGLEFNPALSHFPTEPLFKFVRNFFRSQKNPLPEGHHLSLDTGGVKYLKLNRQNIVTPLAVMLDAAVSGQELRPDTILFARLRADGSLDEPLDSWAHLEALRKNSTVKRGTRLIVPPQLKTQLAGILTLEQAKFFIDYEVLSASTFAEARLLFYQSTEPHPTLDKALTSFAEVRDKAPTGNLISYLAYKGVKTRLAQAAQESSHFSAQFLTLQASGKRPAYFERVTLAREIHHLMRPVEYLEFDHLSKRAVKAEYDGLKERLDRLEKRSNIGERPLLQEALNIIKPLPSIARSMGDGNEHEARKALKALRQRTRNHRSQLSKNFSNN